MLGVEADGLVDVGMLWVPLGVPGCLLRTVRIQYEANESLYWYLHTPGSLCVVMDLSVVSGTLEGVNLKRITQMASRFDSRVFLLSCMLKGEDVEFRAWGCVGDVDYG